MLSTIYGGRLRLGSPGINYFSLQFFFISGAAMLGLPKSQIKQVKPEGIDFYTCFS